MQSSTSAARSVSTDIDAVSIGCSCIVASVTMPVRPMPPAVAQKTSGSDRGSTATTPRAGVTSWKRSTESQNEPCRNLPWMSDAIAPPTVTKRVPGTTIGNQPSGTNAAQQRVEAHAGFDRAPALLEVDLEHAVEAACTAPRRRPRSARRRRSCGRARAREHRAGPRRSPVRRSRRARAATTPSRGSARCGPNR